MKNARRRQNRPLYSQALDEIMAMIEGGIYKSGDRLPSEEVLADQFGVSRPTLRRAMGYLENKGVILRRQGIGTFVSQPSKENFLGSLERLEPIRKLAQKAGLSAQLLEREIISIKASEEIAELMHIPKNSNLICIKAVEAIEEKPTFYIINYGLPGIYDAEDIQDTQRPYFEVMLKSDQYAYTIAELFSIQADEEVSKKLQIDVGDPVMYMLESHLSASGEIIGISYVYSITDRFHFYVIRQPINI